MRLRDVIVGMLIAAGAAGAADFTAELELVKAARLDRAFGRVAVKADRPMPWRSFVRYRYRAFKGHGDIKGGDLAADANAAMGLAILDNDYRRKARLIFVEGGTVPGVPADRWISLNDFENEIMPVVMRSGQTFADKDAEAAVGAFVARATALHDLTWEGLLLVPGGAAGWRPLDRTHPAWHYVKRLERAYREGDAPAMRRAGRRLAAALTVQHGYPPRAKLTLETYLDKFVPFNAAAILYGLSSLVFLIWAATGKRFLTNAGIWLAFVGFVVMTAAFAARWAVGGYFPALSRYECLNLFSWSTALFLLIFYVRTRPALLAAVVMSAAFLLAVGASFYAVDIGGPPAPAFRSSWFAAHVGVAYLGRGAFTVAFSAALLRLFGRGGRPWLPTGRDLAKLEYRAVASGYVFFAVGALAAGAIWLAQQGIAWWALSYKEGASLAVFFIATAYLHIRRRREGYTRTTALLTLLIFAAALAGVFAGSLSGGASYLHI